MEGGNTQHAVVAVVEHLERDIVAVVDDIFDDLPEGQLRAVLHITDLTCAADVMIRSTVGMNIVKRQLTGGDHIEDIHQIRRLDETGGRELSVGVVRYRQSGGQVDVIHRTGKGLIVQAFIKRFQQLARDVLRQLGQSRPAKAAPLSAHRLLRVRLPRRAGAEQKQSRQQQSRQTYFHGKGRLLSAIKHNRHQKNRTYRLFIPRHDAMMRNPCTFQGIAMPPAHKALVL